MLGIVADICTGLRWRLEQLLIEDECYHALCSCSSGRQSFMILLHVGLGIQLGGLTSWEDSTLQGKLGFRIILTTHDSY